MAQVEVLMHDSFYEGLEDSIYPCVVLEKNDTHIKCMIHDDPDKTEFWCPRSCVLPLRSPEPERYNWEPGDVAEVGVRIGAVTEPKGYWPVSIVAKVYPGRYKVRWLGKYATEHEPEFMGFALRLKTAIP